MPQDIPVPGHGTIRFPDEASPAQIQEFLDDNFNKPQTTVSGTAAREVGLNIVPTIGAALGASAGAIAGMVGGPGAVTAGGFTGAVLGGEMARGYQQEVIDTLFPGVAELQQADIEQHPWITKGAGLVSALAGFKPRSLGEIAALPKFLAGKATQQEAKTAIGMAGAAGLGAGFGIVDPILHGQSPTWSGVAESALFMPLFGETRRPFSIPPQMMAAYARAHPTPQRPTVTPELARNIESILSKEAEASGYKSRLQETPFEGKDKRLAQAEGGMMAFSRPKIHEAIENYFDPEHSVDDILKSLVDQEATHEATFSMPEGRKRAGEYWNDFTYLEKQMMRRILLGPKADKSTMSDSDLGIEASAYWLQRAKNMKPLEFMADAANHGFTVRILDGLSRLVRWMREFLGTRASDRQQKFLDEVSGNLNAARAAAEKGQRYAMERETAQVLRPVRDQPVKSPVPVPTKEAGTKDDERGRQAGLEGKEEVLLDNFEEGDEIQHPAVGTEVDVMERLRLADEPRKVRRTVTKIVRGQDTKGGSQTVQVWFSDGTAIGRNAGKQSDGSTRSVNETIADIIKQKGELVKAEPAKAEVPLEGEQILQAAFKDDAGKVHTGPHHPGILMDVGGVSLVAKFGKRESRNTEQFGYWTNKGRFVNRDLGGKIAKASGQDLRQYDEPIHSDQVASATEPGKTVSEQADPKYKLTKADQEEADILIEDHSTVGSDPMNERVYADLRRGIIDLSDPTYREYVRNFADYLTTSDQPRSKRLGDKLLKFIENIQKVPPVTEPQGAPQAAPAEGAPKPGVAAPVEPGIRQATTPEQAAQGQTAERRALLEHMRKMRSPDWKPNPEDILNLRILREAADKSEAQPPAGAEMKGEDKEGKRRTLTPAVRSDDDPNIRTTAIDHGTAKIKMAREHETIPLKPQNEGFLDEKGNWLTRKEAAERFYEITGKRPAIPDTLQSEDLKAYGLLGHLGYGAAGAEMKGRVTARELSDLPPDELRARLKSMKYGPVLMREIAATVDPADIPKMAAERDRLRKEIRESVDKATPETIDKIWKDVGDKQLKAQSLNEWIEESPTRPAGADMHGIGAEYQALKNKQRRGEELTPAEAVRLAELAKMEDDNRKKMQAMMMARFQQQKPAGADIKGEVPEMLKEEELAGLMGKPLMDEQALAVVSRMMPKAIGYTDESIEGCAKWVNSFKPEQRGEALLSLFKGIEQAKQEEAQKLYRAAVAEEKAKEQAAAKDLSEWVKQQAGIQGGLDLSNLTLPADTAATLKAGVCRYLQREVMPLPIDETPVTATKVIAKGGKNVIKLPTAEAGWEAQKPKYLTPSFERWVEEVKGADIAGTGEVDMSLLWHIWRDSVGWFLDNASAESLNRLRKGFRLGEEQIRGKKTGRFAGEIPEPPERALRRLLDVPEGEHPTEGELWRFAAASGINVSKPGWKVEALQKIRDLQSAEARKELEVRAEVAQQMKTAKMRSTGEEVPLAGRDIAAHQSEIEKRVGDLDTKYKKDQKNRQKLISELFKRLIPEARAKRKKLHRTDLEKNDVAWESKETKGAWLEFGYPESEDPGYLNRALPEGSAGKSTATKTVGFFVNRETMDVEALSVYPHPKSKQAMVYDPSSDPGDFTKKHIPVTDLLPQYRVKGRAVLDWPVHGFHKSWKSTKESTGLQKFMDEIGTYAIARVGGKKTLRLFVREKLKSEEEEFNRAIEERYALTEKEAKEQEALAKRARGEALTEEQRAEKAAQEQFEKTGEEADVSPKGLASYERRFERLNELENAIEAGDDIGPKVTKSTPADLQAWEAKNARGLLGLETVSGIRGDITRVEAACLAGLFDRFNIKSGADVIRALETIQIESRRRMSKSATREGAGAMEATQLTANDLSVISALDKMVAFWQEKLFSLPISDEAIYAEVAKRKCTKEEARAIIEKGRYDDAIAAAIDEVYDIAQQSRKAAETPGEYPFFREQFRSKILSLYGDTSGADIEQSAISQEQAKASISRRLGVPGVLTEATGLERVPPTVTRVGYPPGIPRRPFLRPSITQGRPGEVRPPEMLTPEEQAQLKARPAPAKAEEMYWLPTEKALGIPPSERGAASGVSPLMRRALTEGKEPFVPVGGRKSHGPLWGVRAPEALNDPTLSPERRKALERSLALEQARKLEREKRLAWMKKGEEPAGAEMHGDISGVSRRAREVKGEGYTPIPQEMSNEEMVNKGREFWEAGVDHEMVMRAAEKTGAFSWEGEVVARHWQTVLDMAANKAKEDYGLDSGIYDATAKEANDWYDRFHKAISSKVGMEMRALQGYNNLDTGSFTAWERALKEAKDIDELTDEDFELIDEKTIAIGKANKEAKKSVDATNKAVSDLEGDLAQPQQSIVDQANKIREEGLAKAKEAIAHLRKKAPMAMKGPEAGLPKKLSDLEMANLAEVGGNVMIDLSQKGNLTETAWRSAMLDEWENIAPFLTDIWKESEIWRNHFIAKQIGAEKATEPARKRMTRKLPPIELSEEIIKRAVNLDPKGKRISNAEAFHVWNYIKQKYLKAPEEGGIRDVDAILGQASIDLALPRERLHRALATNKTIRRVTEEMYEKLLAQRRVLDNAKNWLKNQEFPGWLRFARSVPRYFFIDKVLGHGTVGMITHASNMAFDPTSWRVYFPKWRDMYNFTFNQKEWMRAMRAIETHPHFAMWKTAGLQIDPFRFTDDYNIAALRKFFLKAGGEGAVGKLQSMVSGRGFDALKSLRLAKAEQWWDATPDHLKTEPMRKLIAQSVNYATGVVKSPVKEWANWAFFAPKLVKSQWGFVVKEPLQAASYLAMGPKASPEQRYWAMKILKQRALMVGMYYGMLALNQGLLKATGSDQDVNFTNPNRSDFWAFKVGGFNVGLAGPMLGVVRLFAEMLHASAGERTKGEELRGSRREQMMKAIGTYVAKKASPAASFGFQILSQHDYMGRPLPWSSDRLTRSERLRGLTQYETPEWLLQTFSPIPAEEAVREVWRDMGMRTSTTDKVLHALAAAIPTGLTGVRVWSDPQAEQFAVGHE